MTTSFLRLTAWLLAAAVTFAPLGPALYRPHETLGQGPDHAFAFVLIGLAFGFAYSRHRLLTALVSLWMIGAVELLQLLVPGRHARLSDFIIDALAASAGLAVAAVSNW